MRQSTIGAHKGDLPIYRVATIDRFHCRQHLTMSNYTYRPWQIATVEGHDPMLLVSLEHSLIVFSVPLQLSCLSTGGTKWFENRSPPMTRAPVVVKPHSGNYSTTVYDRNLLVIMYYTSHRYLNITTHPHSFLANELISCKEEGQAYMRYCYRSTTAEISHLQYL